MKKEMYLSEDEENKLEDPQLFYDISDTEFDIQIDDPPDFTRVNYRNKNKKLIQVLKVTTTYKPVFNAFKNIYRESPEAKTFRNVFFPGDKQKLIIKRTKSKSSSSICIILVHGFKSKNKQIYLQLGERFARRKIDSFVYCLPFHFERMFLDRDGNDVVNISDFRATLEFFRQTVVELRIMVRILKDIGYKAVGVLGFSFGAYCCSLLACLESSVDFIVPIASMGDFGNLWKFKKGFNDLDIRDEKDRRNEFFVSNYLKLICPVNYRPVIDKKNILFIQGLIDGRAPVKDVLRLKKLWENPKIIWYPCDHFSFFLFNRLTLAFTISFLKNLKFQ
jgi:hypothetical protein